MYTWHFAKITSQQGKILSHHNGEVFSAKTFSLLKLTFVDYYLENFLLSQVSQLKGSEPAPYCSLC